MANKIQKIIANFWFDGQAEEAANFYVSVFKDASIGRITRYVKEGQEIHGKPVGSVMTVEFQIEDQEFLALNGGPEFKFSEAISFIINCESQEEIDYYWDKLTEGGDEKAQICGWLKDKFGVSWQVTPIALNEMLMDSDTEKVERVMKSFMQMKKIDLTELQKVYES
ncbi:VOC family protein [Planococcus shenhongbingii]|uniref:VOC family protein n=1 Tax=Planococcus shenhongbingii TaxID=3058398 RepID=A0ABT8NFE1_9BACL|nr:VOC family protein [Planococcus sp. N017]MDN7246424.1 VOC family protein [Planococcus sp. N017]